MLIVIELEHTNLENNGGRGCMACPPDLQSGYQPDSISGTSTIIYRGVAQFGRVLGLEPSCRRFESCHPDHLWCH